MTKEKTIVDIELIWRKITHNGLTDKEEKRLNKWLTDHPDHQAYFDRVKRYEDQGSTFDDIPFDPIQSFKKLNERILTCEKKSEHKLNIQLPRKQRTLRYVHYAASVVILIAFGLFYFNHNSQKVEPIAETQLIVKQNPNGIKSHIKLPDGTHVWLNAASSISYPQDFSDTARLVNLEGEAYFEVINEKTRPFRVTSGKVVTTALGTSFNIKAYENELTKVSLTSGRVNVINKDNNEYVILQPGDQAKPDGSGLVVVSFDTEIVLAWKDGTIYFDDTEFDEAISMLEKWYDVKFKVENLALEKKKSLKATGKYTNMSLDNVLKLLSLPMQFDYTINEKIITLKFRTN